MSGGVIQKCVNYGKSETQWAPTGIAVSVTNVMISDCRNEGTIYGSGASGIAYNIGVGSIVKNCLNLGDLPTATTKSGICYTVKGTIKNCLSCCKIKNAIQKQYYGTDFSAFYVKWKTGYIGLKALDSVGAYMFAIPNEEYLQERGFAKAG